MQLTRRQFCQTAAFSTLSAQVPTLLSAADKPPVIVDTHTHFYDPTRPDGVPWPGKGDQLLYRPTLPEDFLKVAEPCGVRQTVVVEASPWLEDNQWLLDLAEKSPSIVGVVGNLTPGTDEFAGHLQRFAKFPLYRGIRINSGSIAKGLADKSFVRDLGRMVDLDLTLDVNGGPETPALAAELAKELPDLRIVINHCGNLPIDGKAPPANWREGMQAAAQSPHVTCKVSALVEAAKRADRPAPRNVDFYRPELDALWEIFGEERLLYGSNWPVSNNAAPYADLFHIVQAYFQEKGAKASAQFFAGNAKIAYKYVDREMS